ncbi:MAG TPA: S-adenosylmethionine:tRNA ribosyltransferase-isomerase [Streptosporangiaceae bacterium]|nr:S-adenosylmethionine:tRNA ribosyltransferase-isomerase [Streptosporangiaceae bacterium]
MRLAASKPAEERGQARDGVRMLVATTDGLAHATFADLPRFLTAGDLLVVNTSATLAAAVEGRRSDGRPATVHFSTPLDEGTWLVELREPAPGHGRVTDACPGDRVALPGRASLTLLARYPAPGADRLWTASFSARSSDRDAADAASTADGGDGDVGAHLARYGRPIRYSYLPEQWPLPAYQTVFSREPGSAEMPSAGRPFTPDLVLALITSGVIVAPIMLHAGVASLEAGELPLPERFTVPEPTAALVNLTGSAGRRVVAVGTTVTRALESAAGAAVGGEGGPVRASHGWTDLVLDADRPARVVTGLITGWHDPDASHLALLEAVAGPALVRAAYAEADKTGYLGHEFGDSCLLLPPLPPPSR